MTVWETVRATEPTAVFPPQRKYKTVGSKSRLPPRSVLLLCKGVHRTPAPFLRNQKMQSLLAAAIFLVAMKRTLRCMKNEVAIAMQRCFAT